MAKPRKPVVPPRTPQPTYGPHGKPYKPPKDRPSISIPNLLSERTRLGRALKFRKGGYTKGKSSG